MNSVQNKEDQKIKNVLDRTKVKRPIVSNIIKAFFVGGLIGLVAQTLLYLYGSIFGFDESMSISLMAITLVFLSSFLTGIGIYDKIGQFAGAGSIIPITGFSNSMTSAALESKSEGIILGIMTNMFKLAGAIIVAGVVSAFISGTIIYLFQ